MKSRLAVASFVLAVINILVLLIFIFIDEPDPSYEWIYFIFLASIILMFIFSLLSLIKMRDKQLTGKWMAVTSLVISIFFIVILLFFGILYFESIISRF